MFLVACDTGSSRMDRKHGRYIVNVEHSENQPSSLNLRNHEAHRSACQFPTSTDVTGDVTVTGTDLTGACTDTGTLGHSAFPNREFQHCQVTQNFFTDWSLWKIFLACLLACAITTTIGVLIECLVYNGKNNNTSIVIQLPQNHGTTSSTSSETIVPTAITDSTSTSDSTTITMTTARTSREPTSTKTIASTDTLIATATTATSPTFTELKTTAGTSIQLNQIPQ
ncbi:dynactin-associated protein-like [Leopardus geoffroyi]|uniref:dynactin-associated protein-like n=1 Tax=Leopardus geoffroyi TaxID=46844 RepID=UPI001E265EA6|nr:dynactin-associated protein-like [Leopardus geoffroyi]